MIVIIYNYYVQSYILNEAKYKKLLLFKLLLVLIEVFEFCVVEFIFMNSKIPSSKLRSTE